MATRVLRLGFLIVALVLSSSSSATAFSDLIIFGDSLSDTGNLCPSPFCPPTPPYAPGRFSNGDVWVDYLAADLGLSSQAAVTGGTNFAVGGATTSDVLGSQIPNYSASVGGNADPGALYIIWAGGNDGLGGGSPVTAAENIGDAIVDLMNLGAQYFLVPNLPDLALTPDNLGDPNATLFTDFFNASLAAELAASPANVIFELDAYTLSNDIATNPATYGFTNIDTACFDGVTVCANPDEYAYWDGIHPTTVAHGYLGELAQSTIPEPGSGLLVLLGLTGMAARRHRQAA